MIDALSFIVPAIGGADQVRPGANAAAAGAVPAVPGPSFGEVMADVARGTAETLRQAEAASISAIRGDASTLEVVEAIKAAEQALQTATAVRDKAVQAYQEISRMAI